MITNYLVVYQNHLEYHRRNSSPHPEVDASYDAAQIMAQNEGIPFPMARNKLEFILPLVVEV